MIRSIKTMVKIAIDAMGGDFAPREQVLGAVAALNKDKDLSVILCGDEAQIKAVLSECKYDESRVEIVHTTEIITMEESPAMAVKTKKDSSTVVAFRLVMQWFPHECRRYRALRRNSLLP